MARLENKEKANADFQRLYKRALVRHKAELVRLLGRPPNLANVPQDFWEKIREEMAATTTTMALLLFMAAATQRHEVAPGMDLTHADPLAFEFAQQRGQSVYRQKQGEQAAGR